MAIIVGDVKRNLDAGGGAKQIRTVVHTISLVTYEQQVIAIANADATKSTQYWEIDADGRGLVDSRVTVANTLSVTIIATLTTTATTLFLSNTGRRKWYFLVDRGSVVWGPSSSACSIGLYFQTSGYEDSFWRGAVWVASPDFGRVIGAEFTS